MRSDVAASINNVREEQALLVRIGYSEKRIRMYKNLFRDVKITPSLQKCYLVSIRLYDITMYDILTKVYFYMCYINRTSI